MISNQINTYIYIQIKIEMGKEEEYKQQYLQKIQKIRSQISSSTDYLALERCMDRIEKIKAKIANFNSDAKCRKQLQSLIQKCQDLIREKTKYFKKKIMKKLQESQPKKNSKIENYKLKRTNQYHQHNTSEKINQNSETLLNKNECNHNRNQKKNKQKTLKLSKSVDNFDRIKEGYTFRKQNNENEKLDNSFEDDRTQIKYNKCDRQVSPNVQSSLNFFRHNQNSGLSLQCNKTQIYPSSPSNLILEQYHYKMRQKTMEAEQLKGKLKYFQQANRQLKNRLLNQQRRHDDYINSLKVHITKLNDQVQKINLQKKTNLQVVRQNQHKIQIQENQIASLADKLQKHFKQKQKNKLQQSRQSEDLRRQLQTLSKQQQHIRKLDYELQMIKTQNKISSKRYEKLQFEYKNLKEDCNQNIFQKQQLEELIQLKLQQNQQLKTQLRKNKVDMSQMFNQIQGLKQVISKFQNKNEENEKIKQRNMNRKLDRLRQVRSLLLQ